jgi:tripartite-type tricarboxylate transporter receptor subunit TctC
MKTPRRQFLHLVSGAAALPAMPRLAWSQTYPTRPVRIIVGFAAGGPTDIVARLMAQWLSEHLGQEFVVENRPGTASNIGTEAALRAPPDGYTLLLVTSTNAVNVTFYENLNFNFMTDIAPVAGIIGPWAGVFSNATRKRLPTSTAWRLIGMKAPSERGVGSVRSTLP